MKTGEKDLAVLLKSMNPFHNLGDYVFCVVPELGRVNLEDIVLLFKEQEGYTLILRQDLADQLQLEYTFVAAWLTLTVHSSLEAVGLTAAFSKVLSSAGISCNVVAAFHHDHIFVDKKDAEKAMAVLKQLSS